MEFVEKVAVRYTQYDNVNIAQKCRELFVATHYKIGSDYQTAGEPYFVEAKLAANAMAPVGIRVLGYCFLRDSSSLMVLIQALPSLIIYNGHFKMHRNEKNKQEKTQCDEKQYT